MNCSLYSFLLFSFLFWNTCAVSQETEQKFSLYFENDVYELNEVQLTRIDSLHRIEIKDSLDVHIKGYTNSIGSKAYNLELSRKRAENVKDQLREFTIISSNGYGELGSEAANNRRVDVLVHYKRDHIVEEGEIREEPVKLDTLKPTIASMVIPKKGDKIILEGIRFYVDRDVIMDESRTALDELVTFLTENPSVRFKLIGHICCGDTDTPAVDMLNARTGKRNLSQARARALHNYLAKKGIETKRMQYIGMAYRYPLGMGDSFDRRVEIEITYVE